MLRTTQMNKTPLVLVACGSFSPISVLHLQMFEMAERYTRSANFDIFSYYLSKIISTLICMFCLSSEAGNLKRAERCFRSLTPRRPRLLNSL